MRRTLLSGLLLAGAAALVVLAGQAAGLDLEHIVLVGIAVGAILALSAGGNELAKLGGFAGGFVATWVAYALRAAVLPDTSSARALAVFLVIVVVMAACSLFEGSAPAVGALSGAAAMAAAYEQSYTAAPSQFLVESPSAATSVLLVVAIGYVVVMALPPRESDRNSRRAERDLRGDGAKLDDMFLGETR